MTDAIIEGVRGLREVYAPPGAGAVRKQLPALDEHCQAFIALSPFLVIASAGADGSVDASPRGDAPGFVAVRDAHTLIIPDRPGNNRIDTLTNMATNPHVGLLFMVPGMNETLRVNGTVQITTDPEIMAPLAVQGKLPRSCLVVTVKEAFLHCARAFVRSDLWNPAKYIDRAAFPSLGCIMSDQVGGDAQEIDRLLEKANANLY